MKKLFAAAMALAGAIAVFAQDSKVINAEMPSAVLGQNKTYTVYLPAGYDSSADRYPVLYLLHGAWGNDRDWSEKGTMKELTDLAIKNGTAVPMIVVMPDARGVDENFGGERMGYFSVPGWDYERYFFDELMPHIDSTYRTIPDKKHRAIAGLSMGGGGTVVYAQKHPDLWAAACSLSGLVGLTAQRHSEDTDYAKSLAANDPVIFLENASEDTLGQLRTVRWFADCGDDDFLADSNLAFYTAMRHKGIPIEYRMRDGAHNWTYWRTALPEVLRFSSSAFTH